MTPGLNIAALSRRTGVAPDTLRKWEQRYRILQPSRTSGGQRRYSERDVARVEWLCDRLRDGYRIGEAANLLGTAAVTPARSAHDLLSAILNAVALGDTGAIGLLVDQAFALYDVEAALDEVLAPLLREIGERWARGELTVAEEHVVSEVVRSRLGNLLADAGGGVRGTVVLACAPGERHELGLMMLAIALRRDGWKVTYLGADTPFEAALALALVQAARVLGISVTTARFEAPPDLGVDVVLGGPGAGAFTGGLAETVSAIRRFAA